MHSLCRLLVSVLLFSGTLSARADKDINPGEPRAATAQTAANDALREENARLQRELNDMKEALNEAERALDFMKAQMHPGDGPGTEELMAKVSALARDRDGLSVETASLRKNLEDGEAEIARLTAISRSKDPMQAGPTRKSVPSPASLPATSTGSGKRSKTTMEVWLSISTLVFGLCALGFQVALTLHKKKHWDAQATRMFGLVLIITCGLYLTTAGDSDQQITPMAGLLGTIAGFLLGRQQGEPAPAP